MPAAKSLPARPVTIKAGFYLITFLLTGILAVLSFFAFYRTSAVLFFCLEGMVLITAAYLVFFYRRIVRPLRIIGNGMELLKGQDFSSRLSRVGQADADRVVNIFNKLMEQLKDERLRLREQNHFLDLLILASPMGVVVLDPDWKIVSLNPAAQKILHLTEASDFQDKQWEETGSLLARELARIPLGESRTIRLSDANIYKCTHSYFIEEGFHHPFFLIESLTEEVFKAEKIAYGKVIRMISHEVNNTTAGITSTLDTLLAVCNETDGMREAAEAIEVLIDRCYGLSRFISRFADVVRIPEPQKKLRHLNEVITGSLRFMETACQNRNIEFVLNLCEQSPQVEIDSLLFEQVLVNLIKNAAESIGSGGKIYITTFPDPTQLEIADTGKGISRETEEKLFSPFFSTKPGGQGIGLIFTREVLLRHGCSFSLRTDPDGLTRFRILF